MVVVGRWAINHHPRRRIHWGAILINASGMFSEVGDDLEEDSSHDEAKRASREPSDFYLFKQKMMSLIRLHGDSSNDDLLKSDLKSSSRRFTEVGGI